MSDPRASQTNPDEAGPSRASSQDPASPLSFLQQDSASSHTEDEGSATSSEDETPEDADPFYDAAADDEDEQWVADNLINSLRNAQKKDGGGDQNEHRLACPSCFSLLCLQCQQHEEYDGQFRAVFVRNCVVAPDANCRIRVTEKNENVGKEEFQAVGCGNCGTDVAVLDREGVYHFCNVLY